MTWKDILKAPRDDNRRMINAVIKYIKEDIKENGLSNLRIVDFGEFDEGSNTDAKEMLISLKDKFTGNFYPKERLSRGSQADREEHFMRVLIEVPKKAEDSEPTDSPPLPPEILAMIGLPARQRTEPDNRYAYDLALKYDFFGDLKETKDLLEFLKDLKIVNDSMDAKDLT
jgi:hypothetical protein